MRKRIRTWYAILALNIASVILNGVLLLLTGRWPNLVVLTMSLTTIVFVVLIIIREKAESKAEETDGE